MSIQHPAYGVRVDNSAVWHARRSGAASPGTTNLAAWWSMDETSGTRYDSHTGNYDLSNSQGTNGYTTGVQGNAVTFASSWTSVYFTSSSSDAVALDGDAPFTITYWVYFTTYPPTYAGYVVNRWGTTQNYTSYFTVEGEAAFLITNGSNYSITTSGLGASAGNWYFVVCWHDPNNDVIGVRVNQGTPFTKSHSTGAASSGSSTMRIGNLNGAWGQAIAYVDEVNIWNEVLSSDELDWLYNSGSGRTYSEL